MLADSSHSDLNDWRARANEIEYKNEINTLCDNESVESDFLHWIMEQSKFIYTHASRNILRSSMAMTNRRRYFLSTHNQMMGDIQNRERLSLSHSRTLCVCDVLAM